MSYAAKDFAGCKINPFTKDILSKIAIVPDLKDALGEPIELSKTEKENLTKYAIMVYDPASPLVRKEKDLPARKERAADLAELKDDPEYRASIYSGKHPAMPIIITRYLIQFAKSKYWAAICAFETTFWESIFKLIEPISGKDSKQELESVEKKSKIKTEIDSDIKRLEDYYLKFFGDDTEIKDEAMKKFTPEMASKAF